MKLLGKFSVGDWVEMVNHNNHGIPNLEFGNFGKIEQIHSDCLAVIDWNNKLIPKNLWHYTSIMLKLTHVNEVDGDIKPKQNQILYHGMFYDLLK